MKLKFEDLHPDVQQAMRPHMPESNQTLDTISKAIARKRDEAKTARSSSGIEQVWTESEEAYVGIDDANRSEFQGARWIKPQSMEGPVTTGRQANKVDPKSTVYVRLTSRYVDAGASKLGEILLPVDDKSFKFTETPIPDLVRAAESNSQVVHDGMGNIPLTRDAKPEELPVPGGMAPGPPMPAAVPGVGAVPPAGAAGGLPQVPLTVKDLAQEKIENARKKAKRAEDRIYDWMVECHYQAEVRKVIFDSSRIGVGVLKAPFPKSYRSVAFNKSRELQIKNSIKPASCWVDPWNIFPDPACGESIHEGDFIFERDYMSERQVRDLKKLPGYISTQIDKVIEEGPAKITSENGKPGDGEENKKGRYEIWYYYGSMKTEEYDCVRSAADNKVAIRPDKPNELVFVIGTMINSTMVKASINPLDSGSFPYHSHPWQRRAGHWAGIGVGEQLKAPQKMLNASTRAMLNNAGISAGGQIIIDKGQIVPADGSWIITPNKVWYKTEDSEGDDVSKAFTIVEMTNSTNELMEIVTYALKLAEESTSIPLITQGQTGPTTPDTLGATQLQNNNANQLLRSIGYAFDDYITEPVVRQYYEWLLLDPDVPDDEKGDFTINAHGSIALVERAIQDQTIAQMAAMVKDPAYGMDPRKWAKEFLKSKRINPEDILYSDEELKKIDAAPPPKAPIVEAAQIRAEVDRDKIVVDQKVKGISLQNEHEIATAAHELEAGHLHAENSRTLTDATVRLHELQLNRELAMLQYANARQINLDQVHKDLARTMMQLDTEKQLNALDHRVDLHKHRNPNKPPVQTPGKAGKGRAFEQGPTA